jgi:hypothetical protein
MLHITNGDSVAGTLRLSGLGGDVATSADVLHEGPCLTHAGAAEYRHARAAFLAAAGYATFDEALERLVEADAVLERARGEDEVVFWFEHDLFDQLLLVRLLAWFAREGAGRARLTLICIGEYPGMSRFDGLGQLSPAQLAGLFPSREPVSDRQLALGADAWARFGRPDPHGFAGLVNEDTRALPFLAGAVVRQLEELPSTGNGLSRSERQALSAIGAGAPDVWAAFRSTQEMEERVFCGDATFFRMLDGLATAPLPLIRIDAPQLHAPPARRGVSLTPVGQRVLAGTLDHALVNGVDRWIGGVHVEGRAPAWRWDPRRRSVVDAAP